MKTAGAVSDGQKIVASCAAHQRLPEHDPEKWKPFSDKIMLKTDQTVIRFN
jgi:hypothetical protein